MRGRLNKMPKEKYAGLWPWVIPSSIERVLSACRAPAPVPRTGNKTKTESASQQKATDKNAGRILAGKGNGPSEKNKGNGRHTRGEGSPWAVTEGDARAEA